MRHIARLCILLFLSGVAGCSSPSPTNETAADWAYDVGDDPSKALTANQAMLNRIKMRFLYMPLADQGNAWAQFHLGYLYGSRPATPKNEALAVRWLGKAADQGNAQAQFWLALRYEAGRGVTQDDKLAVRWYRMAAEQGYAKAQVRLGRMYYDGGDDIPKDDSLAFHWWEMAAEQGDEAGQALLATMYLNGEGVPVDKGEAVKWYRRAAEQGNAEADLNLGYLYESGEGVPQDYAQAVRSYRSAAEKGNATAQYTLAEHQAEGRIVQQDLPEAYFWFSLVAAGHYLDLCPGGLRCGFAEGKFATAVAYRDQIGGLLAPTQIAEVQKLARDWRPNESNGQFSIPSWMEGWYRELRRSSSADGLHNEAGGTLVNGSDRQNIVEGNQEFVQSERYVTGQRLSTRYFDVTVNSLRETNTNSFEGREAGPGNKYLALDLTITNTDAEPNSAHGNLIVANDGGQSIFDCDPTALSLTDLNPAITERVVIYCKVPEAMGGTGEIYFVLVRNRVYPAEDYDDRRLLVWPTATASSARAGHPVSPGSRAFASLPSSQSVRTDVGSGQRFSEAPSFDCAKASIRSEFLICADDGLARLDVDLAEAYVEARGRSADKAALQGLQNEWRRNVRDKCMDKACIANAYTNRAAELRSQ